MIEKSAIQNIISLSSLQFWNVGPKDKTLNKKVIVSRIEDF